MTQIMQITRRVFAWVLTLALVFTMMPGYALADEGSEIITDTEYSVTSGSALKLVLTATSIITDFAFIDAIQVEIGTQQSDIPFPTEVIANVQTDGGAAQTSTVTAVVCDWQLAFGEYDPDVENRYVFEAVRESLVLPNGVILPEDFYELPCVAVDIGDVEIGIQAATAITGVDYTAQFREKDSPGSGWGLYQGSGSTEVPGRDETWSVTTDGGGAPTLTLSGFNFTTEALNGMYFPANTIIALADGTSNSITSTASSENVSCGISAINTATLTITGDTGSLTVTGGNPGIKDSYGINLENSLTIEGGEVTANGGAGKMSFGASALLNVTGGTFNAVAGTAQDENGSVGFGTTNITVSGQGKLTAKGNDIAILSLSEPTAPSARGTTDGGKTGLSDAMWVGSSDMTYKIDGTIAKYMELGAASGGGSNADTVKDALVSYGATGEGAVTVDGETVTLVSGEVTITGHELTLPAGIKLVLKGGTVTVDGQSKLIVPAGATLEIDGCTLNLETSSAEGIQNNGTLTIATGTLKVANSGNYGFWNSGTLNISGGTVNIENTGNTGISNESGVINITNGAVNITNSANIGINNTSDSADKRGKLNISGSANISIANTGGNGILNKGDMAISGGSIDVENSSEVGIHNNTMFAAHLCGEISMSGGTMTVANIGGRGISISAESYYGHSKFAMTGGTLQGSSGTTGNIELGAGSKVTVLSGSFNDRDTSVTATGEITVGAADATASASGLSAGIYAWDASAFKKTSGGDGGAHWYTGQSSPYTISAAAELLEFAQIVNGTHATITKDSFSGKTVKLANSIDLNNTAWTPIGISYDNSFKGVFDGQGYEISNLNVNTTANVIGLFGSINGATIQNFGVSGNVSGGSYTGGIVGTVYSSKVENCYFTGTVSGADYTGGIAGHIQYANGIVKNCYNIATVSGDTKVGGIVGNIQDTNGIVQNCYNTGTISGKNRIGGIVGYSDGGTAKNCISLGLLVAAITNTYAGRVVGQNYNGIMTANYARNDMTVTNNLGAVTVTSLAADIHGADIAVDGSTNAAAVFTGWDGNVWGITASTDFEIDCGLPTLKNFTATQNPTLPGDAAPTITTTSLPNGTVGTAYSQTLAATGDTPITWSLDSGTLPAGLSFNASIGAITGTPTTAVTADFTVKAANSTGSNTKLLSITINAANGFTITFNANGGSVSPTTATTGTDGKLSSLPTPIINGSYSFNGWYTATSGGTKINTSYIFTTNATVYAQWKYTGGGTTTPEPTPAPATPDPTPTPETPSSGGGGTTTPEPTPAPTAPDPTPTPETPSSNVIVDGKEVNAGEVKTSGNTTTVTVNQDTIRQQLKTASSNVTIVVPAETGIAVAQLVVQNVDDMAAKDMSLTIQVGNVHYEIPATAVDTASILTALGAENAGDVLLSITISTDMSAAAQAAVQNAISNSGGAVLVIPPMEFKITASYNGKTVEIDTFSQYVSRSVEITAEQAAKITTAIVVDPDGMTRHVPTKVYQKGGKWYAEVSSLTNSIYAFIYNERTFTDAKGKWYEAAVNEMASRMVISGIIDDLFAGECDITRAEFAAIIVKALGLPTNGNGAIFKDVSASAWYCGAVGTAYEYGLVSGIGNNQFAPDKKITRQEVMVMVQRAAALAGFKGNTGNLSAFTDASGVSDWALDAANWNVGSGLIVGSYGKLMPTNNITRAETAMIVLRLLQKSELVDVRGSKTVPQSAASNGMTGEATFAMLPVKENELLKLLDPVGNDETV